MANQHQEIAQKVVEQFKASLSEAARAHITTSQFNKLASLIEQAIAHEMAEAADLVERAARKLRAGTARPELGL